MRERESRDFFDFFLDKEKARKSTMTKTNSDPIMSSVTATTTTTPKAGTTTSSGSNSVFRTTAAATPETLASNSNTSPAYSPPHSLASETAGDNHNADASAHEGDGSGHSDDAQSIIGSIASFLGGSIITGKRGGGAGGAFFGKNKGTSPQLGDIWHSNRASSAYRSGTIRSCDLKDLSASKKIRLAFRNMTTVPLVLCWISHSGAPKHFYHVKPLLSSSDQEEEKERENTSSASASSSGMAISTSPSIEEEDPLSINDKEATSLVVTTDDHVETSELGHAFVFARQPKNAARTEIKEEEEKSSENKGEVVESTSGMILKGHDSYGEEYEEEDGEEKKDEGMFACFNCWKAPWLTGGDAIKSGTKRQLESKFDGDEEGSEKKLDPADVVAGYRPMKLTLGENTDDYVVHIVTISRRKVPRRSRLWGIVSSSVVSKKGDLRGTAGRTGKDVNGKNDAKEEKTKDNEDHDQPHEPGFEWLYVITVHEGEIDRTPIDNTKKFYCRTTLGGWPVRCEPGWDDCDGNVEKSRQLRARLTSDLRAMTSFLPPHARELLRNGTPIWINKSMTYGPKVAPVKAGHCCFHPGKGWLVDNGMSPEKEGGVEVFNVNDYLETCIHWGQGGLMLHEFSHAFHHKHVSGGFENEDIKKCYESAMEKGLYDCVKVHGPQGPERRGYACTDPMEYFAELSAAFLGGVKDDKEEFNKWYPFNRAQIRHHDPDAYEMLKRIWHVKDDDDDTNDGLPGAKAKPKETVAGRGVWGKYTQK